MKKIPTRQTKTLFLLDQELSQLSCAEDVDERQLMVCGDGFGVTRAAKRTAKWEPISRSRIIELASGSTPLRRVGVMCIAGRGKSTNMAWLAAALANERPAQQLPVLIELDSDHAKVLRTENSTSEDLLEWLIRKIHAAAKGTAADVGRMRHHLLRKREQGHITLLLDGLDHFVNPGGSVAGMLAELFRGRWGGCPIWIAGRPEAFKESWSVFAGDEWEFMNVEPLAEPEIHFYLNRTIEPDIDPPSGKRDWIDAIAPEGRHLLATPRLLFEITRTMRDAAASGSDPLEAVRGLQIRTKADVYQRAYLEPGSFLFAKVAGNTTSTETYDRRGLIAQGVHVHLGDTTSRHFKYPALPWGVGLDEHTYAESVRGVAGLLGAIAFEMYANPKENRPPIDEDAADEEPLDEKEKILRDLRPNIAGVPIDLMPSFKEKVADRLRGKGLIRGAIDIDAEFTLLGMMNVGAVGFLYFRNLDHEGLLWHDRTVQAFFAAYWAARYASSLDRKQVQPWKGPVHSMGRLADFDEFWQFVAEMPDAALRTGKKLVRSDLECWREYFMPCYESPRELRDRFDGHGDLHEWVQWHRRMIYYTVPLMDATAMGEKARFPEWLVAWRQSFQELANGTKTERRIFGEIMSGFRPCPKGIPRDKVKYLMGSPATEEGRFLVERQRLVEVTPFRMHEFPATHEQYELFDPGHRQERWRDADGNVIAKHPAGKEASSHPVVNVTFWDAFSFACWTGHRIPTEMEWEFACRAGTTTPYHFGQEMDESKCNLFRNWKGGSTNAMAEIPSVNDWGLYEMHGNVFEWCDSLYEPGASRRVLRGGSWVHDAGCCRSAFRDWDEPENRFVYCGFRLAEFPLEPSRASQRE